LDQQRPQKKLNKILENAFLCVVEKEIEGVVAQVISELQASSPKDIGKVMKSVMEKFSGKVVDGKLVSQLVRIQLGS
jgi:uncharacterized protein YqeY